MGLVGLLEDGREEKRTTGSTNLTEIDGFAAPIGLVGHVHAQQAARRDLPFVTSLEGGNVVGEQRRGKRKDTEGREQGAREGEKRRHGGGVESLVELEEGIEVSISTAA